MPDTFETLLADVTRAARRAYDGATEDQRRDGRLDLDAACALLMAFVEPAEDLYPDHECQRADRLYSEQGIAA